MKHITLFHCTNSRSARFVCEEGLKINESSAVTKGKIFLSTTPQHIFGCVCFKVTIPSDWVELHYGDWEYICRRNIPVHCIEFHSYEEDE